MNFAGILPDNIIPKIVSLVGSAVCAFAASSLADIFWVEEVFIDRQLYHECIDLDCWCLLAKESTCFDRNEQKLVWPRKRTPLLLASNGHCRLLQCNVLLLLMLLHAIAMWGCCCCCRTRYKSPPNDIITERANSTSFIQVDNDNNDNVNLIAEVGNFP